MSKEFFWSLIKDEFEKAEQGILSIFFSSLGYRKKGTIERIEIEYQKYGITLNMALMYLKVLASENLIELIDSENMGYYIMKK